MAQRWAHQSKRCLSYNLLLCHLLGTEIGEWYATRNHNESLCIQKQPGLLLYGSSSKKHLQATDTKMQMHSCTTPSSMLVEQYMPLLNSAFTLHQVLLLLLIAAWLLLLANIFSVLCIKCWYCCSMQLDCCFDHNFSLQDRLGLILTAVWYAWLLCSMTGLHAGCMQQWTEYSMLLCTWHPHQQCTASVRESGHRIIQAALSLKIVSLKCVDAFSSFLWEVTGDWTMFGFEEQNAYQLTLTVVIAAQVVSDSWCKSVLYRQHAKLTDACLTYLM